MAERRDIHQAVAYLEAGHDDLGRRLGGLEKGFHILQGEVHTGFSNIQSGFSELKSKIDSVHARPTFNFHEMVRTVLSLVVLLGAMVSAVIWIVNGQFSGVIAEQKAFNNSIVERLIEQRTAVGRLTERTQWLPADPTPPRR